jgi:phosphatidylglycerol:prolipoprotein diacylglycerol transferase
MYLVLNSIAFKLGPISVHWYGIILGSAALIALLIAIQEGKRFQINPDFFMDFLLVAVPSAIVGARAYYVIFKWDDYKHDFWGIFQIWNGGIAIYGALIGSIIGVAFYVRAKGYNFWRIADITVPGLIIGQMIGRWGNFMNQEAHGGPVEESFLRNTLHLPDFIVNQMYIKDPATMVASYYHPTFLYESVWNLLGFILLIWLRRRPGLRAGELFISYFIWYSIGRFFIEGLRTDSLAFTGPSWLAGMMNGLWSPMKLLFSLGSLLDGNIRISQALSILIILVAIILIVVRRKLNPPVALYSDPIVSTKALPDAAVVNKIEADQEIGAIPHGVDSQLKE